MKKRTKNIVDSKLFIITAITIGGSLEWYEIGLFIAWPLFIQNKAAGFDISIAESINAGTILLLVILALANGSARALGGWFFGKKGDETGRQKALSLTLLIATLPSWSIALLSFLLPYHYWLTYATAIFTLLKFFQGMPAGGEIPGAICYLAETANDPKSNNPYTSHKFICSFALIGPLIGTILSTSVCLILHKYFSHTILIHSVWRYVFIFSGILGIIGYMMRKKLHETTDFLNLKAHHKITHKPIQILFSQHFSKIILAALLSIFEIIIYVIVSLVPFYFSKKPFNFTEIEILLLILCYSILYTLLIPTIGLLAAKYKSFGWLNLSVWGTIFFSPILYWCLLGGNIVYSICLSIVLMFFSAIQSAILPSLLAKIFPIQIRYSGIAFSYNICDGILWSSFIGICFLFIHNDSPAFILLLPIAALVFPLAKQFAKMKHKNIYKLLN